jgi:hypothetical protein
MKKFNEFVNEGYATRVGDNFMDYLAWSDPDGSGGPMDDSREIISLSSKALGVDEYDLYRIDSEDDDSRTQKGIIAAEKAFSKGPVEKLKLTDSGVGGPFLEVNKKAGIVRYDEYGFTMFIFTNKSKF